MAFTYYFLTSEDDALKHGDDMKTTWLFNTASQARKMANAQGYWAQNSTLTRYVNHDGDVLCIVEKEFDPYEQRWLS